MMDSGILNSVNITYFSEKEKDHIIQVMEAEKISNYNVINCQELKFVI